MADVEIKGRITVDSGNAIKSTNQYLDAVKEAKKSLKGLQEGTVEYQKAQENLAKATKDLNNANVQGTGSFAKLKETLNQSVPGFQGASQGASGLGKQLWALAANPIVAILAAIVGVCALLYKAFASTAEGADQLGFIMDGVGQAINVIRDRILKVGEALAKFFKGDFKGAIETGKKAVNGFGEEVAAEFNKAKKAAEALDNIEDRMQELGVIRAKNNAMIAKSKEMINDETASYRDKKKALNEVSDAEIKYADEMAKLADDKFKNLQSKWAMQIKNKTLDQAQINELQAAETLKYNLEEEAGNKSRQLQKIGRTIEANERSKQQAAIKEGEDKRKTELANLRAFESKATDLNNELKLSKLKDGQEKELLVVNIGLQKQKEANKIAVQDKQLTQKQANELNEKYEQLAVDKRLQILENYNVAAKKKDDDLKAINKKTAEDDSKALETLSFRKIAFQLGQAVNDLAAQKRLLDEKQRLIEAQYQSDLLAAGNNATKKAEIEQKHTEDLAALSDARIKIGEAEAAAKLNTMSQVAGMFGQAADLIGKHTAVGKAMAIAQTSIDTYVGAQKAYNSMSAIPVVGPALGTVAAGLAIAGGLANVKKIFSVQVPGGGGSMPSAPSFIPPPPITPQRTSTAIDKSSVQDIGNAAKGGVARAFVVDRDITNNQERNARIQRAARLS